jgi:hypothetical protein
MQFPIGAVLQHSNTPLLRVAGFEDEDDDEDENEAPHENLRGNPLFLICFEGVDRTTAGGYRSYAK